MGLAGVGQWWLAGFNEVAMCVARRLQQKDALQKQLVLCLLESRGHGVHTVSPAAGMFACVCGSTHLCRQRCSAMSASIDRLNDAGAQTWAANHASSCCQWNQQPLLLRLGLVSAWAQGTVGCSAAAVVAPHCVERVSLPLMFAAGPHSRLWFRHMHMLMVAAADGRRGTKQELASILVCCMFRAQAYRAVPFFSYVVLMGNLPDIGATCSAHHKCGTAVHLHAHAGCWLLSRHIASTVNGCVMSGRRCNARDAPARQALAVHSLPVCLGLRALPEQAHSFTSYVKGDKAVFSVAGTLRPWY
jgi:hypothetical protein